MIGESSIEMQARENISVAVRCRYVFGDLQRLGRRPFGAWPGEPVPGTRTPLVTKVDRMDALLEVELIRECRVDGFHPGHWIDISAYVAERVIILLEGITDFQSL